VLKVVFQLVYLDPDLFFFVSVKIDGFVEFFEVLMIFRIVFLELSFVLF